MSGKHDMLLDLDINSNAPKTDGFFTSVDKTPTPTKLYNCEEYSIFENDILVPNLKLVNPFDEIFRHAVEQKSVKALTGTDAGIGTGTCRGTTEQQTTQGVQVQDEESLHTPQVVFPQLDVTSTSAPAAVRQQSTPLITELVMTDADTESNVVSTSSTSSSSAANSSTKKYRAIAEKPTSAQLLTVNVSDNCGSCKGTSGTAIPIQTVKPLILPKVETKLKPANNQVNGGNICTVTSPSSASLTPTSQLPIKERLKVILNNKTQLVCTDNLRIRTHASTSSPSTGKYNERCMERRRAAATRYRNKMRNEHKDLRKRNTELQAENEKLRARITELEQQLAQRPVSFTSTPSNAQIHIPPSSIHLIMNIPKLIVPANGPPLLHNPITYNVSVEKK